MDLGISLLDGSRNELGNPPLRFRSSALPSWGRFASNLLLSPVSN